MPLNPTASANKMWHVRKYSSCNKWARAVKGSLCDILNINTAANNYLQCKDIVEKWLPEQRMNSHSLCVCVVIWISLFFVLVVWLHMYVSAYESLPVKLLALHVFLDKLYNERANFHLICRICVHSSQTVRIIYISHKLKATACKHRGCVFGSLRSLQPLTELSTHQRQWFLIISLQSLIILTSPFIKWRLAPLLLTAAG